MLNHGFESLIRSSCLTGFHLELQSDLFDSLKNRISKRKLLAWTGSFCFANC